MIKTNTSLPALPTSMRAASAQANKPSQQSLLLSIDDVCILAERTRMRTSLESRHLVVSQAEKRMRKGSGLSRSATRLRFSRGRTMTNTDETPPISGRVSSRARENDAGADDNKRNNSARQQTSSASPLGFIRDVHIRFKPRHPHSNQHYNGFLAKYCEEGDDEGERRLSLTGGNAVSVGYTGSDTDRETGEARSPCQCADVRGREACRECREGDVYSVTSHKMQTTFPPLSVSAKHVTSSALVRRVRPDMTPRDIQEKIMSGQIANTALIFPRRRLPVKTDERHKTEKQNLEHKIDQKNPAEGQRTENEMDDEIQPESQNQENKMDEFIQTDAPRSENEADDKIETKTTEEKNLIKDNQNSPTENGDTNTKGNHSIDDSTTKNHLIANKTKSSTHEQKQPPSPIQEQNSPTQKGLSSSTSSSTSSSASPSLWKRLKRQYSNGEATTPLYFMDLKHMNSKIFYGRSDRIMKRAGEKGGGEERRRRRSEGSEWKPVWPAFVSPRKCKLVEEPRYKSYFDPPLLAKHKQIPNPSFFAGSQAMYCLPERLPEVLEFSGGKLSITDPNTLITQSSPSLPLPKPTPVPEQAASAQDGDAEGGSASVGEVGTEGNGDSGISFEENGECCAESARNDSFCVANIPNGESSAGTAPGEDFSVTTAQNGDSGVAIAQDEGCKIASAPSGSCRVTIVED